MWTNHPAALSVSLLWLALVTVGYLFLRRRPTPAQFAIILLTAGLIRLVPLLLLPVGAEYDIRSYQLTATALSRGEDIYSAPAVMGRHPYLPFFLYPMTAIYHLAEHSPIPFVVLIKLFFCGLDLLILYLLYRAKGAGVAWQYSWHPIPILVVSYHGQFDALPTLFLLLAWYGWQRNRPVATTATSFGFAILSKTWPVMLWPALLIRNRHRWHALSQHLLLTPLIPLTALAVYLLIFNGQAAPLLQRIISYQGTVGFWGVSGLLRLFDWSQLFIWHHQAGPFILAITIIYCTWQTRAQPLEQALFTILLAIFAVSVGTGLQWLFWLVPFGLLASHNEKYHIWFALTAGSYIALNLFGLHLGRWLYETIPPATLTPFIIVAGLPVWIVILLWLRAQWRQT